MKDSCRQNHLYQIAYYVELGLLSPRVRFKQVSLHWSMRQTIVSVTVGTTCLRHERPYGHYLYHSWWHVNTTFMPEVVPECPEDSFFFQACQLGAHKQNNKVNQSAGWGNMNWQAGFSLWKTTTLHSKMTCLLHRQRHKYAETSRRKGYWPLISPFSVQRS